MNEFIYIIGLLVASYIAWRFGSQQKQDAIEGLQEEIQESRRLVKQAEKHAESMSIMNHGLSREIMQLTKALMRASSWSRKAAPSAPSGHCTL